MVSQPAAFTVGAVYLDSPVFISAVSGGISHNERGELHALLQRIDSGALTAVISTFVIAEVRRLDDDGSNPDFDPIEADNVKRMFQQGRLVVRPLTEHIALRAVDIGNQYGLLPGDCVHIATAEAAKVDALFTRDGSGGRRRPADMLRHDGKINGLRIIMPFCPNGPLFDHLKMIPVGGQPA